MEFSDDVRRGYVRPWRYASIPGHEYCGRMVIRSFQEPVPRYLLVNNAIEKCFNTSSIIGKFQIYVGWKKSGILVGATCGPLLL